MEKSAVPVRQISIVHYSANKTNKYITVCRNNKIELVTMYLSSVTGGMA